MHCDDVALLPREMTYTLARDTSEKLLDIHTHQKFFTYQIPTIEDPRTNVVIQRFAPKEEAEALGLTDVRGLNDVVLRLRAEMRAANMDHLDQGMRVSINEEGSE